jgi:two-component system, chemotaxis family, chemotaxis protein CheY
MTDLDDGLTQEYLAECCEHLAGIRANLIAIEKGGAETDERQLLNSVFRAVHSVRAAGFLGLMKIRELAQRMEDVLSLIRSRETVAGPHRIRVLLRATERLHELIQTPGTSNHADIADVTSALSRLCTDYQASSGKIRVSEIAGEDPDGRLLRLLLVEDDAASRLLLKTFLSRYGECHLANNGREAVEMARAALERGRKYDLICMDIMMPEMNGRDAVRQVRALEEAHGMLPASGAKIIMTTAVHDMKEVIRCFEEFCDGYLMKPIDLGNLLGQMKSHQLIQ